MVFNMNEVKFFPTKKQSPLLQKRPNWLKRLKTSKKHVLICTWIRLWPSIRRTNNRICNPRFPALLTAVMKWLKVVAQGMEDSDDEEEGGWWLGGPSHPDMEQAWRVGKIASCGSWIFNCLTVDFFDFLAWHAKSMWKHLNSKIGSIFVQVNNGELVHQELPCKITVLNSEIVERNGPWLPVPQVPEIPRGYAPNGAWHGTSQKVPAWPGWSTVKRWRFWLGRNVLPAIMAGRNHVGKITGEAPENS